jgi:hypothetical protein
MFDMINMKNKANPSPIYLQHYCIDSSAFLMAGKLTTKHTIPPTQKRGAAFRAYVCRSFPNVSTPVGPV